MSKFLDHRALSDEMEIFFLDDQIGAGLPVWLPNGVAMRDALECWGGSVVWGRVWVYWAKL